MVFGVWKKARAWIELQLEPVATTWITYHCLGDAIRNWQRPFLQIFDKWDIFTGRSQWNAPAWQQINRTIPSPLQLAKYHELTETSKEMAPHSITLAWKIPWTEGAAVPGVAKSRTRLSDFTFTSHFSLSCIGEGNGNPLQCSCLENPRDRGAWWAAVYEVTQSRTRPKWLSSSSSSSRAPVGKKEMQFAEFSLCIMKTSLKG